MKSNKNVKANTAKRLTAKQIDKIFALAMKGYTQRQIAAKIPCHPTTVWYHLNSAY